jgi:DNA-binding NarL/FixJ family response regulator
MPEQFLDEIRIPVADGSPEGDGVSSLTPRERQVLAEIMAGASNKVAGRKLGISPRTVEVHRSRIMEKLGAKNGCDLVRIVLGRGPGH